jgi:hypothetical protein
VFAEADVNTIATELQRIDATKGRDADTQHD